MGRRLPLRASGVAGRLDIGESSVI